MNVRHSLPDPRSDVSTLQAFVAVARSGSVGRAAIRLDRTQPSVSSRLATLERAWEIKLFHRLARGMRLTPEGAKLLPKAEALLRGMEELDRAAGLPLAGSRALRIGAGDALGRETLPRALPRLLREFPGLDVRILEGPRPRLLDRLGAGEIDVALVVADEGPAPPGLDLQPILQSEVELLAPRDALGAGDRPVRIASLANRRLVVLQRGSAFRRHLESEWAERQVPFRPSVEVGNLSLVRRFVAAGLGFAPVPAIAFSGVPPSGVVKRRLTGIGPLAYQRAVRAGVPLSSATDRLLELL